MSHNRSMKFHCVIRSFTRYEETHIVDHISLSPLALSVSPSLSLSLSLSFLPPWWSVKWDDMWPVCGVLLWQRCHHNRLAGLEGHFQHFPTFLAIRVKARDNLGSVKKVRRARRRCGSVCVCVYIRLCASIEKPKWQYTNSRLSRKRW